MAKRSKKPADLNRLAASIVDDATDEAVSEPEGQQVNAGRLGGQRGGRARTNKLSPQRRKEIATEAAEARWKKR